MGLTSDCGSVVDKSTLRSPSVIVESLGDYKSRLVGEQCAYSGCLDAPEPDSDRCAPHGKQKRDANAAHMRRKRKEWANAGLCKQCGRVRRKGSSWGCAMHDPAVESAVDKRSRIAANTTARTSVSNLGRTHYHGHGARGRVSNAQLDGQDFDDAIRLAARAKAEYDYAASPEVGELPIIQRQDAKAVSLASVARTVRHLAEILHRNKVDVRELVAGTGKDGE